MIGRIMQPSAARCGCTTWQKSTRILQDVRGSRSTHVCQRLCLGSWWSDEYTANRESLSSFPGALHCAGDSMGGDLRTWWGEAVNEVQTVFLNLILGRMYHRGKCRVLTPRTHTILRSAFGESIKLCVRHRSVNYAAGAISKRCNLISMILCAILHYAPYCTTTRNSDDVYHPPSFRCDLHRQIHWSTLCAWYVQHSQEFHTLVQYMCNKKVGLPKSCLHLANVLYPAPCHPLQPRIAEF